jgi:electron transfer flavoprotein beta subunit
MKIAVLVKQVPDTYASRVMDTVTRCVDRNTADQVIDEITERALAVALELRAVHGGEVIAVTMGPPKAAEALRRSLAVGADAAVHALDPEFAGADALQTAAILAATLRTVGPDLVVGGCESTDGKSGALPAMLAEHLGFGQATFLRSVTVAGGRVTGTRVDDGDTAVLSAGLPCVISVVEEAAEPVNPGLKGIMSAKRKPLTVLDAGQLDLTRNQYGAEHATTRVIEVAARAARSRGELFSDDGSAGDRIADLLRKVSTV